MDISQLLTARNASLPVVIILLTSTLKMVWPEFYKGRVGQRLTPLLPILFGLSLAFAGAAEGTTTWQSKMMVGFVSAFTAGHLFKVGKSTFVSWGQDIAANSAARKSMVPDAPSADGGDDSPPADVPEPIKPATSASAPADTKKSAPV